MVLLFSLFERNWHICFQIESRLGTPIYFKFFPSNAIPWEIGSVWEACLKSIEICISAGNLYLYPDCINLKK